MFDPILHKHIDEMDKIEDSLDKAIDKIFESIDVEEVLNDTQGSMLVVAQAIKNIVEAKYAEMAIEQGLEFVKKIEEMKRDIEIQKTKNPNINEAVV